MIYVTLEELLNRVQDLCNYQDVYYSFQLETDITAPEHWEAKLVMERGARLEPEWFDDEFETDDSRLLVLSEIDPDPNEAVNKLYRRLSMIMYIIENDIGD